ncbi:MAG: BrnA antitoxin family protein [Coriobacteriales bacterium]|jgi:predicted DNA binding CopG/RHH family protein|nr:BrnA antitoxin family protein [Coriobacteriales bacterium]
MDTDDIRAEYDFSSSRSNPYAKKLKKQITIRIDIDAIDFFKQEAAVVGIPYQSLINLYLADCAANKKKLRLAWK